MKIDRLLEENAKYQANNVCVNNTEEQKRAINEHCNKEFIDPIKEIDPYWFDIIKKQSE